MAIVYGNAGWIRVEEPGIVGTLYLRLAADGRVIEMYLDGGEREITPGQLRRLPLGRLRAHALTRPDLLFGIGMWGGPDPEVRTRLGEAFPDSGVRVRTPQRVRLRPPVDGLTDDFLTDVARAYQSALARGERPNKALAEQTGYPKRTVERWVYLARKSGHLGPTRSGQEG